MWHSQIRNRASSIPSVCACNADPHCMWKLPPLFTLIIDKTPASHYIVHQSAICAADNKDMHRIVGTNKALAMCGGSVTEDCHDRGF